MVGWVASVFAPGVIFLAAGTFARHHIRVSAADARIFDWFVGVDHDAVFSRSLYHFTIVFHHELPVMPLPLELIILVEVSYPPPNIAGFDGVDPQTLVRAKPASICRS